MNSTPDYDQRLLESSGISNADDWHEELREARGGMIVVLYVLAGILLGIGLTLFACAHLFPI